MLKTYAVQGLMEWSLQLATGDRRHPYRTVVFTGGQVTGYHTAPARFTTADPVLQQLIESSGLYYDRSNPPRDENGDIIHRRIYCYRQIDPGAWRRQPSSADGDKA